MMFPHMYRCRRNENIPLLNLVAGSIRLGEIK